MQQMNLPLLGRLDAPSAVPAELIGYAKTYRDAVRMCWALRRRKGLKPSDLGRDFGFTRQHVGDYLAADDKATRRSLPAERISDFEQVCENSAVTQWLASRAHLTVLEQMQADQNARRAA